MDLLCTDVIIRTNKFSLLHTESLELNNELQSFHVNFQYFEALVQTTVHVPKLHF